MDVRDLYRQAPPAGGFFVGPSAKAPRGTAEALLILADGSIWRGWSARNTGAVAGDVTLVGDTALVGDEARLTGPGWASLLAHLIDARVQGQRDIRGCMTAPGATSPLHATVGLAVARGEIGRP